jgi:hypothetical protein
VLDFVDRDETDPHREQRCSESWCPNGTRWPSTIWSPGRSPSTASVLPDVQRPGHQEEVDPDLGSPTRS